MLVLIVLFQTAMQTWTGLHGSNRVRAFDLYTGAMDSITKVAKPNDRVFHSNWDQFPVLFARSDQVRYIAGLDPTFLLAENPALSDAYTVLTTGRDTKNAYGVIHDQFHAQFVLLDIAGHANFAKALTDDPRFVLLYDDGVTRTYQVTEGESKKQEVRS